MATLLGLEPGVYIHGELVGAEPGREWTDKQGNVHKPYVLSVLIGKYVESVEFEDEDAARANVELGGTAASFAELSQERGMVTVPVRVRGSWDEDRRRFGRVSFLGRRGE